MHIMADEKKYSSESSKQAAYKYKQKNIKRIPLDVQIDEYDRIKAFAEARGMSVNGFIKAAIFAAMDAGTE